MLDRNPQRCAELPDMCAIIPAKYTYFFIIMGSSDTKVSELNFNTKIILIKIFCKAF